jgi:heme-degrading monooxygenase HmoA
MPSRLTLGLIAITLFGLGAATGWAHASEPVVLVVQLESEAAHEDVVATMERRAAEFRALPGLSQKYYLHEPGTKRYGAVYVFRSQADLDAYLKSDLRKSLGAAYKVKGAPDAKPWQVLFTLR